MRSARYYWQEHGQSTDVFVSYAHDTKPLAEELTRVLQREGINAWADFKDLRAGQKWIDEIENALDRSQSVVFLISPHSQSTRWTDMEWRMALTKAWADSEKVLIPVVVGGNDAPPFLSDCVPLRIDPTAEPHRWTSDVLDALRSHRHRAVSGNSSLQYEKRIQRLDEMARKTEELRDREPTYFSEDSDSQP